MQKIDWRAKLASRKFWSMVTSLLTFVAIHFHATQESVEAIASIIGIIATMCVYILAEGYVDAKGIARDGTVDNGGGGGNDDN